MKYEIFLRTLSFQTQHANIQNPNSSKFLLVDFLDLEFIFIYLYLTTFPSNFCFTE